MGNPFFYFLKYWPKRSKKKFRIEIWIFSFQFCFKNQFSTLGSGQTENTHIREYVYFQFDHFPKSKIDFLSRFEMRISIFIFWIFFLDRFGQYLKKSKNGFPIVFSKGDLTGVGSLFLLKKFLKKQHFPKYALVLVVACRKLKSGKWLITPANPHAASTRE